MSDDFSIPNPGYRGNRVGRYGNGPIRPRRGMDPDTRRLMMFAGALGAILVALIGASALMNHHSTGVPVIAADAGPVRVKPENPGGMKIDGAENDIFSGGSDTADARLAPPPEIPDAKALRTTAALAPPAPTPATRTEAAVTPPPAAVSAPAALKPAPVVASAAPSRPPLPAATEAHPSGTAAAHTPAAGHQPMVQLAALGSEEAAHSEWQLLEKRMPALLSGRQPIFSRTEVGGHTFWRVRTSGFADVAQARTFCDHVREKGSGCSVADF